MSDDYLARLVAGGPMTPAETWEHFQDEQDLCAAEGHPYHSDADAGPPGEIVVGRCYCGTRWYPAGGPDA